MVRITEQEKNFIKKAFRIQSPYTGIDVALDSIKFHQMLGCDIQKIREKVEFVLQTEFGDDKYHWDYEYDAYADGLNGDYCCHHISLNKK